MTVARYEASVQEDSESLQAVFVSPDVADGVRRLREIAKAKRLMMRIQVLASQTEGGKTAVDRSVGVIGLEQAISLSFKDGSDEAELVRAIIRAPEALKPTVDAYMKKKEV